MASSPQCQVPDDELAILADRLGRITLSKLGKMLGIQQKNVTAQEDDQDLFMLLKAWRDDQGGGSDVRECLAEKLKSDFPDESDFILKAWEEGGKRKLYKNQIITERAKLCFIGLDHWQYNILFLIVMTVQAHRMVQGRQCNWGGHLYIVLTIPLLLSACICAC